MYALLLAFPHIGMPAADQAANTKTARDILDRIHEDVKIARAAGAASTAVQRMRGVAEDPEPFVLLATLWQKDSLDKAVGAYQTAISIHTLVVAAEVEAMVKDVKGLQMSNNLATLYFLQGNIEGATGLYEEVLSKLGDPQGEEEEILQATLLYNLGRAYEDADEYKKAQEAYRGLLSKHPEYTHGE